MTMSEVTDASEIVHSIAHPDANIIFGSVIDDTIGDAVRVTVIAAGLITARHRCPRPPRARNDRRSRSDIFASTTSDDFFDVGGDDDLPASFASDELVQRVSAIWPTCARALCAAGERSRAFALSASPRPSV